MKFTTPPPVPCKDKQSQDDCSYWAESGDCKKNKDWMKDNCYASCKYC